MKVQKNHPKTKNKSLFTEFMNVGQFMKNDFSDPSEMPLKTQLQNLLSSLPDEEQLAAFEGEIRTIKTTMSAMHFESPSMDNTINQLGVDVYGVRDSLRSVISRIQQLLRDLSFDSKKKEEPASKLDEKYVGKWTGKSAKYSPSELKEKFGEDKIKQGMKVELEHTTDKKMALRIVFDHLLEDEEYYNKLKKIESDN